MWQTDAIGLWKCDLGLPSHRLSPRQLTTVTVRELSDVQIDKLNLLIDEQNKDKKLSVLNVIHTT
jgi:hypothetical protein